MSIPMELPKTFNPKDEAMKVEPWDFQCQSCGKIWKFEVLKKIERIQNVWAEFGYEWPALQK
jgi:hypothetical protein